MIGQLMRFLKKTAAVNLNLCVVSRPAGGLALVLLSTSCSPRISDSWAGTVLWAVGSLST